MGNDTAIAVDVAKNVFELGISDRPGVVRRKQRLHRPQFLPFLATQPAATVVMEACGSAQFWARRIEQLGHRVVLLPAHLVRPYVRGNKTDRTDVKGILEAYRNEDIRPVPLKTPAHQTLVALHRLRSAWVAEGRRASIPSVGCCVSSACSSRLGRGRSCPRCGCSYGTQTRGFPTLSAHSWPRRAKRCGTSNVGSHSSSASLRRSPSRRRRSNDCSPYLASGC